jgi:CHAT domain-containing protein/tetratricopeptide (TPR) repeat protein
MGGASAPANAAEIDFEIKQSTQLFARGRYQEAAEHAQEALALAIQLNDEPRKNVARYSLGLACVQLGEYTIAEGLLSQVLSPAGSSDDYGYVAFGEASLASMYFVQFRRLRAQNAAVYALLGDKKLAGAITSRPKDIDEFASLYEKALSGPSSPPTDLIALAIIQDVRGDHAEARRLLLRAAQGQGQPPSPPVARAIIHVGAAIEMQLGDNNTVENLLTSLIKADEATAGPHSLTVATDLNVLGGLEGRAGNFEKAAQYVHRALDIDAHDTMFRIPFVTSLNYQGSILAAQGDPHKAEAILDESLGARGPDLADNEVYRADAKYALSGIYWDQGRLFEAFQLYAESVKVYIAKGYEQQALAALLSLSRIAGDFGKTDMALQSAKEAADYMVRVHSQDDPSYLTALDLLGVAYMRTGDLANAQQTFEQASEIIARHPGFGISAYADLNVNYAYVLAEEGHYNSAKLLIQGTIAQEDAISPAPLDALVNAWKTAAWVYDRGDDSAQADSAFQEALKYGQLAYSRSLAWLSERDRLSYVGLYNDQTAYLYSYCDRRRDAVCAGLMYDTMLWQKNMVASGIAVIEARIHSSKDVAVQQMYKTLEKERSELSAVKLLEAGGHNSLAPVIDRLEANVNALEQTLLTRFPDISNRAQSVPSWNMVKGALSQNQAVIEIARYNYNSGASLYSFTQPKYVALVLTHGMAAPSVIDLGPADKLEHAGWQDYIRALNGEPSTGIIEKLVWEPIKALIGDATEIYVVPDGILNKVAFGALSEGNGVPLLARYRFSVLSNSGDLVRKANVPWPRASKSAALMGNPLFASSQTASDDEIYRGMDVLAGGTSLAALPGTAAEIHTLGLMLRSGGWTVEEFTGGAATKAALNSLKAPRLLHIATHGYFISESEAQAMSKRMPRWYADDVLLRSGLFLAGSSTSASGPPTGILTAYEASGLNLRGTELVVLSACDTGLGEAENGEGVLGLRRALREAGARAVLMSLWSVPDRETEELMSAFYSRWLGGTEMHEALREAELELRDRVISRYGRDVPKYWAGFVLSG